MKKVYETPGRFRLLTYLPHLVDVRRFETSSPMPVQLLLLHDQWVEGGEEEEANGPGHDGVKQLL